MRDCLVLAIIRYRERNNRGSNTQSLLDRHINPQSSFRFFSHHADFFRRAEYLPSLSLSDVRATLWILSSISFDSRIPWTLPVADNNPSALVMRDWPDIDCYSRNLLQLPLANCS